MAETGRVSQVVIEYIPFTSDALRLSQFVIEYIPVDAHPPPPPPVGLPGCPLGIPSAATGENGCVPDL